MKNKSYYLLLLSLVALVLLSCSSNNNRKDGRTDTATSGTISFTSDASFSPLIEEERSVFEATYPDARIKSLYMDESAAIDSLLQGKVYLTIAGRDFKKEEKQNLIDRQFGPTSFRIAYDGLALIVNRNNLDTCISVKDFIGILKGKITKWSELNSSSNKGDIQIVFDNMKSSTVHFVEDSLLGGKPITNSNVQAVNSSKDVIDYVEKTTGAIGVIGSNWLNDKRDTTNLTFNRSIRVMSVSRKDKATAANSWKPYQYYLLNGNYPLVRTIYALVNDPYRALPWNFAQFIAGPKGQMIVLKSGLLPYRGDITIRDVSVK